MIKCYIPSKNRASQVDTLLRSFKKNAPGLFDPYVVYTFSNEEFKKGYEKAIEKFPEVTFTQEENGERDFTKFLRENNDVVGLFADDCIFYRKTNTTEEDIRGFLADKNICNFNFRLGNNIKIQDYIRGNPIRYPSKMEEINEKFLKWNYREFENKWESNFGFPNAFDGYFFNSDYLLFLINGEHFDSIFLYEHLICHNGQDEKHYRDFMICPLNSEVVVQQINSTHNYGLTNCGKFVCTLDNLNINYLNNYLIDLDSIDFANITSCHDELKFNFIKV